MKVQKKRKRSDDNNTGNGTQENKKEDSPNFLLKLYKILETPEYQNIIHWSDNGKYFIVQNLHDFTENILNKYYKHNNYSSFVRQLNMYDFHKIRNKDNFIVYEHSMFCKNGKNLIGQIKRKNKQIENGLVPIGEKGKNSNDDVLIILNNKSSKKNNKKNLAKTLNALIEKAKQTGQKQNSIESKISILNEANNDLISQNRLILQEISNKTEYNKKLESIVLFVIELLFNKPTTPISTEPLDSPISNKTDQLILKKENDISNFFQKYMEVIKNDNSNIEEKESKLENSKIDYNLNQIFGSSSTLPQDSTVNSNMNNQPDEDIYLNDNEFCFDNSLNAINTQDIAKDLNQCFFNLNDDYNN